jgi:molybdopterin synthase catalytic subunit
MMSITIQVEPVDVTRETQGLQHASHSIGAIVTFLGLVRDVNEGQGIKQLALEHYPGMAEKEISKIIAEARQRWSLEAVRVVHRVGPLQPTELIVYVGVASLHRGDAFAACEYIMDHLKTQGLFWKKEQLTESDRWLEPRPADQAALQKWHK